jgi:hypothetical protein
MILYSESKQFAVKVRGRSGERRSEVGGEEKVRSRSFSLALQVCPEAEQTLVFRRRIRQRIAFYQPHVRGSYAAHDQLPSFARLTEYRYRYYNILIY